jgi:hypothetical protein
MTRFQEARQSVAEFCRKEGVSAPTFYQWRKRLAQPFPARKPIAKRVYRQYNTIGISSLVGCGWDSAGKMEIIADKSGVFQRNRWETDCLPREG